MGLKHDEGWTIPVDAPYYPFLPAAFRNVKMNYLFFSARPEAVGQCLPEPLERDQEGTCVAFGVDVPYTTNYGCFQQAGLLLKCSFRDQVGYYCSQAFTNAPTGIAAGREIYGTPEVFADVSVRQLERSMLTEASVAGIVVLRLSSITEQVVPSSTMPALIPSWRVKVIPRADGPGPAIKQLIDCSQATQDLQVHFCARGKGTLTLMPSPLVDLSPLQPVRCGDAFYMDCDFSEHYASIVYDYLKE